MRQITTELVSLLANILRWCLFHKEPTTSHTRKKTKERQDMKITIQAKFP